MACFIATVAEAIVVSAVKKHVEKKESAASEVKIADNCGAKKISFSQKLGWLTKMLWGGSFLLAIEHIWHGEVVLYPPFLTAMNNPADIAPMLLEIATVGVSMALVVTLVWLGMLGISYKIEKNSSKSAEISSAEA